MATSYVLGFNPIWTAFDLVGRPAGGAKLYSWHNLNPTIPFPIYTDASGLNAWTNPILFNENGQQGPFYFLFDSGNPQDTYFLQLFDADNNLIWEVSNYFPGSGGGSVVTTTASVKNYLGNSVFWRFGGAPVLPAGTSSVFTNPADKTVICPGNHAAIYTPDIYYTRPDGSITDAITITPFPQGVAPLNNDNTPEYYLNYKCTAVASGSTIKGIAFPVVSHLQSLEDQPMTFCIWAQGISGLQQLNIQYFQFTGTGSNVPTPTTPVTLTTFDLTPTTGTWTRLKFPFTTPSTVGLTLGNNNNDAFYMIVGLPLSTTCEINFTNVRMYLGTGAPDADFDTYDQIDSVINTPRTGDTRISMNSFAPYGWVAMNDGTIGNPSSGATTRANFDTFYLYKLIWDATNSTSTTQAYAPIQTSGGVLTTRGATADADFAANKRLQLLYAAGAVLGNVNASNSVIYPNPLGAWALGQPFGQDQVALTEAQMPGHTHTYQAINNVVGTGATSGFGFQPTTGTTSITGNSGVMGNGALHLNVQPTLRMNIFIKL